MKRVLLSILALCLACMTAAGCAEPEGERLIDIDMTALSETMRQAEFFHIMSNAADYVGKTIRANGPFESMFFDFVGLDYNYVVIIEGDACCPPEGFEIRLGGEGEYPEIGAMIEVVGVLDTHDDFGPTFVFLAVDEIEIL